MRRRRRRRRSRSRRSRSERRWMEKVNKEEKRMTKTKQNRIIIMLLVIFKVNVV